MEIFIICAVALACSLANVDSATRMVESTDLAYSMMITTIFCKRFIHSGPDGFESSVLIGYCAAAPYFFGAEGYGACCGCFDISCWYF